jgi:hypothetical protein
MYRIVMVMLLGLALFGSAPVAAQNSGPQPANPAAEAQAQQETIRALLKEVNDLKARVTALESRESAAKPTEAAKPAEQAEPKTTEAAVPAPGNLPGGAEALHAGGIKMQGFAAVTYKASDARPPEGGALLGFRPGSSGNFAVGDIDLFLTSQLTPKTLILTEIAFSEQSSGEFETDVERVLLKYDANDYLKMSFGRFHTATSYFNSVFHHGGWLQTTADRPFVVEFSDHGGMVPSQAIGASITGKIPSGKLGLNYVFEYGTASIIRPQINVPGAPEIEEHNGNEITGGLFARPDWLHGLEVGGSFYHDRISPAADGVSLGVHMEQSVASARAVYVTPKFEFLSEGFLIQHKVQETGQKFNAPAFYGLISKQINARWRPFFRFQYANASAASPLFSDISLRYGPSLGVRYDLNDYIAFKTQYDRTMRRGFSSINGMLSQLAFRF